ncbi:MAG: methyltransferase domain-containing protein [Betaproteobacteria bacterium]|nr:methyltransferase domain-containing protein [Betaproteobacteria bacterium]
MIRTLFLAFVLSFTAVANAQVQVNAGPYVPSPNSVVSDMLSLAAVGPADFVIDLGSGDGRIVLTAAKVYGARGFGVEIKDELVKLSNEAAQKQGVAERVKFIKQDLFKTDISQASVLTMYLLPDTVNMLSDKLQKELKPGTRIISHDYPLSGWLPEKYEQFDLADKVQISGVTTTIIYLYVVPAQVAGRWSATLPASVAKGAATLEIKQQLQKVSGNLTLGVREVPLQEMKLVGDRISFSMPGERGARPHAFTGQVKGGAIEGLVESAGVKTPWSAKLAPKS